MEEETSYLLQTRTVIIGAGVAGVSSACHLLKNDYNDFLIFEALERVGGRIFTVEHGDSFLEMGAQYIHGQENNPIYYIARENKQIDDVYNEILSEDEPDDVDNSGIPINLVNTDSSEVFLTEDGQKLDLNFVNDIYKITSKAIKMEKNSNDDISVAHLMLDRFNKEIEENCNTKDYANVKPLIDGIFMWR